jgi:DNA modification methylase
MTGEKPDTLELIHPDLRHLAIPIELLNEDPENANDHDDASLDSIAWSFQKFGQRKPIVVRREGMVAEAGSGSLSALRRAGWTHLACIICDDDESTAMAYGIADNQTARLAKWNIPQLQINVDTLLKRDYDLSGLGWSADELADILAGKAGQLDPGPPPELPDEPDPPKPSPRPADDPEDDEVPDPPPEPITKFGDVIELGPHVIHCADCMDVLRSLPDNSVDAIVTDPPYGLSPDGRARTWDDIEVLRREGKGPKGGFMGRAWDAGVPGITWARECLRVLKPGGHIIAFSATRTVHRLACALEDAGFELRDQIGWLQWQGFPKSHNVSLAIDELHGAERPVVGRRTDGVGNTDRSLHKHEGFAASREQEFDVTAPATEDAKRWDGWGTALKPANEPAVFARKPLVSGLTVAQNVLKWGTGGINIDACRIPFGDSAWPGPSERWEDGDPNAEPTLSHDLGRWPANIYACPKPANRERNEGTEGSGGRTRGADGEWVETHSEPKPRANHHPTVKPVRLMRWLLRLVTPPGGTVVEPFGGSGTTIVAASGLNCKVIASEMEPQYCDIIRARVEHALAKQKAPG